MKKLLFLALVFGMTSAADAALTWSVDEVMVGIGETVVVQLISDSDQPYSGILAGADASPTGVAEITSMTVLSAAAEGSAFQVGLPGWWQIEAVDFTPPSDIAPGPHFDVTITAGSTYGTYTINSDFYGLAGPNDTLLIIVPEPMTIAMLGLGDLFLLRRRK